MTMQSNSLYFGDCLEWMQQWDDQSVDLIYLDPPFNSNATYNILYSTAGNGTAQVKAFDDTWHWDTAAGERYAAYERAVARPAHRAIIGLHQILGPSGMLAYLTYMAERLEHCHRLLKPTGSLYLHCDPTASYYLRLVLDAIFGADNFRNEIIWCYQSRPQPKRYFGRKHDVILSYSQGKQPYFNWQAVARPLAVSTVRKYRHTDKDGRKYRLQGRGITDSPIRSQKDVNPRWEKTHPHLVVRDYLDEKQGTSREDWWVDVPILNQAAHERMGYPTQKPVALLERIINASSNPGDVVLDPFCGCGTAIDAAQRLGRQFVGIDISSFATDLIVNRRLRDRSIPIYGIPADLAGARQLARERPFDFETWAVHRLDGFHPNDQQRGDRGIDGLGTLYEQPERYTQRAVAQVKGGEFSLSALRDFLHVTEREDAALGCYITLEPVTTRDARREAAGFGTVTVAGQTYPRMQLWPISDYFAGRPPRLPLMADPFTGDPVQPILAQQGHQYPLLD